MVALELHLVLAVRLLPTQVAVVGVLARLLERVVLAAVVMALMFLPLLLLLEPQTQEVVEVEEAVAQPQ